MATIFVNYPEVALGAPVEIPGIGMFPNGEHSEYEGEEDLVFPAVVNHGPEGGDPTLKSDLNLEEGN